MVSNCDQFYLVVSGDTCSTIASNEGISLTDFYAWNPAVGTSCEYLGLGDYVCVDIIGYTPSTTTATSTTTTTAGNGITTPTPIQTGMASNCDLFYLVVSGDTCSTIASNEGVGLSDFYAWNPAVGTSCQYLGLGDYVCVGVIATTSITTTTTTGDGITTPTPIQTGMVATCDSFYLVVSGDQCGTIASNEGISLADFYAWNPAVGTSCQYLGLGDYVCVGVIGATSTTTSTTTTGDGITTPTPIQTGMVTNCDSFYLVVSGDECGTIATEYGISLTDFYAWNPAVGSSCQYLGLGDYVCVSIL
jgi:LysM repeat protein